MALALIVRSGEATGDAGDELVFDGERVVVGRGASSDLRLPDPSVSHKHASLRAQGGEWALVDEGSTNGTFVGGVRLAPQVPRVVRAGDLVRVGRVWLEVRTGARAPTPDPGLATKDLALALVARAMDAMGEATLPRLEVVQGPDLGADLVLADEGRVYVLGRAETCDLALADADASREHVGVVRRGLSVLARDLGSKNGATLGDVPLAEERDVPWRGARMLALGRTVIALDEPVGRALAELEAAADEVVPKDEPPPPEPPPLALPLAPPASVAPGSATSPSAASVTTALARELRAGAETSGAGSAPAPSAEARAELAGRRSSAPRARVLKPTDVALLLAAAAVLATSVGGLFWLLR